MFIQLMLKNKTLLCISYRTCPTVSVNTHLACLTYGRVPTKRRNNCGARTCVLSPYPTDATYQIWLRFAL